MKSLDIKIADRVYSDVFHKVYSSKQETAWQMFFDSSKLSELRFGETLFQHKKEIK